MRITALSDTHGYTPVIKERCDIFIHAGDFSDAFVGRHDSSSHLDFITTGYIPWLFSIDAKYRIVVAGNHDTVMEHTNYNNIIKNLFKQYGVIYLENQEITIDGIKIYGSPWTPWFLDWAFNSPKDPDASQRFLASNWDLIPNDTDILVTHGPPRGILDRVDQGNPLGCSILFNRVKVVKPKLHIFGHIHDSYGQETHDDTIFANVSMVNEKYQLINKESIFNINKGELP